MATLLEKKKQDVKQRAAKLAQRKKRLENYFSVEENGNLVYVKYSKDNHEFKDDWNFITGNYYRNNEQAQEAFKSYFMI